jgi:hypothetical protein
VRALVQRESAIAFEAALADAITDVDGVATCTRPDLVALALQTVTTMVFTYWVLEMQKQSMQHKIQADLSTRQMTAAINMLNNALPLFPFSSTESKFCEREIIGLLEWLLAQAW